MKRLVLISMIATAPGCSFGLKAELLNPWNKSGRIEHSEPVPAPKPEPAPVSTPKPSPSPTPNPEVK
jgi:hypothetical protein